MKYLMKYLIDFAALALLYALVFFPRWRAKGKDVLLVRSLMYIYISFVMYFTLMPVITSLPFIFNHPYKPMNMIPFIDVLHGRGNHIMQVVLNVIMTVPFGFLFPLTQRKKGSFGKTMLCCFLLTLSIELIQPLMSGTRSSDITDIITNVCGGLAGYVLYLLFKPASAAVLALLNPAANEKQSER